eukprot:COSAG02_NODE_26373_length_634_cov_1.317757_1_plen_84_part_10
MHCDRDRSRASKRQQFFGGRQEHVHKCNLCIAVFFGEAPKDVAHTRVADSRVDLILVYRTTLSLCLTCLQIKSPASRSERPALS